MTHGMESFFDWLLRTSWQAAVLALLVLAVQWIFQKRLSASWRHALWLLVLVRLLLPVSPHSALSLFNYTGLERIGPAPVPVAKSSTPPGPSGATVNGAPVDPPALRLRMISEPITTLPAGPVLPSVRDAASAPKASASLLSSIWKRLPVAAAWCWLAGVVLLTVRITVQNLLFARRLRTGIEIRDAEVLALFERCKSRFGLRVSVRLFETSAVTSPAIYGWWHPRLLLPNQMLAQFNQEELRYVFLHELAHIKRRDMAVHWLTTALRVLHWFNPVLGFAFRRLAADRELACDEMALGQSAEHERRPYGETILKLLERCAQPAALPGLLGLLEDKDQMTRRITMIARFRKHSRWSLLALALVAALGLVTLTDAQSDQRKPHEVKGAPEVIGENQSRPNLVGVVKSGSTSSKATVFIFTAGPKVGTSTYCPSCYADCRKSAKTDEQGNFKIESLDPSLLFRILVVAKDCKPKFVPKVDPSKGPVKVKLEPVESREVLPDRTVRGQVVDPAGQPVVGAVVEAHGIRKKNDIGTMWGTLPGVDPLAVTDEHGEFLLTAKDPFEALDVRVEARALAHKQFTKLTSGTTLHKLALTEGATITGRVTWQGKPLAGVSVGLVSSKRDMENFTGNFDVGTDAQGRFSLVNLPPDVDYMIYGMMGTLHKYGATPAQPIHAGGDGSTTDAGELEVGPAFRLAGQVVCADGAPVPAKTRLLVGREGAWDSMQILLDKDGRFDTTGIPRESISLSVRLDGYHVSARNGSLDQLNPFHLIGRVDHDITNLVLLLEKGPDLEPNFNSREPESEWPQNRPLRGAEAAPDDHSKQWLVSGQVQDRESRQPLSAFQVTPGNADPMFGRVAWDQRNAASGSNGSYSVYLSKRFAQPVLKVEAKGYLPAKFPLQPESRANLALALEKGAGPSGKVLLPDGKPAAGVSVVLLVPGDEDVSLRGTGELRGRWRGRLPLTGPDGSFSLEPELGMRAVVIAAKEGFKLASVPELATNSNLVLEPWGRVEGVLHRAGKAGTNEDVDLALQDGSLLGLEYHTVTDSQGRFVFQKVPPGRLLLNGRIPLSGNSWHEDPLQNFTLAPGQSLTLDVQAAARGKAPREFGSGPPPVVRESGPGPSGVVLLPDGKPAAEADVALEVAGQYIGLSPGALRAYSAREQGLVVHTDPDGHFALPAIQGAAGIIVVHENGFARVSLKEFTASSPIKLQAWGRLEGTLRVGRRFGTNEQVVLESDQFEGRNLPFLAFENFQARTDEQGRFVFTLVPPGEHKIARMVPQGNGSWTHANPTPVMVKPGVVTTMTLGGNGRTVRGRARVLEATNEVSWQHADGALHTPFPAAFNNVRTMTERQAWFRSSGAKDSMKHFRSYPVTISGDGSFHADEVPPGDYELDVTFMSSDRPSPDPSNILGRFHQLVAVPKTQNPDDDAPADLGTIEAKLEPFDLKQ
jgi:beta-lactamase regulating signal transducer with metallopeptidase domain/uncharacterized GH25 family protein